MRRPHDEKALMVMPERKKCFSILKAHNGSKWRDCAFYLNRLLESDSIQAHNYLPYVCEGVLTNVRNCSLER